MMPPRAAGVLAFVALAAGVLQHDVAGRDQTATPVPHRGGVAAPLDFRGPGRDDPEPEVAEVVIGWFGPGDLDHAEYGSMWRGALLALELENADGGYCRPPTPPTHGPRCSPFRLVPTWSDSPWQAGIADLLRLTYARHTWAVVGGVDGASTHLALQVALKSRFTLVSPGSSDRSTDHANVPWLFSLAPSDEAVAIVLADALVAASGAGAEGTTGVVVAAADHDSHAALMAVRRELRRRRISPSVIVEIAAGAADDPLAVAAHVMQSAPRSVLVIASAEQSARVIVALRRAGFGGPVLGTRTAATTGFARTAGDAAEGVMAPQSPDRGPGWSTFAASYERRWAVPPDEAAVNAYDAVRLVAAAVRRAGLNRARIRDEVRALSPWAGAGGDVRWDARGRNRRGVALGRWTNGLLSP